MRTPTKPLTLREFQEADGAPLSRLALAAFEEFRSDYSDWAAMSASISDVIALHTSPIMTAALTMYRRMGFEFQREAPPIFGVPSAVYLMRFQD